MPQCNECGNRVEKIHRFYKQRNYCYKCYIRVFKKLDCPSCGKSSRLHKTDNLAICQHCEIKYPCIRCQRINYRVGKVTEQGPICNSCSVYFREFQSCERCGIASQRLSRISRFEDNLRVCPKCATRDYRTCQSCRKYRLVEQDIVSNRMLCKKCLTYEPLNCLNCEQKIPAGCGKYCESCSWRRILDNRLKELINTLENSVLKGYFNNYINWLNHEVGSHKAALLIRKHIHFFEKSSDLWSSQIPSYSSLLDRLRTRGLRKYELPVRWLITVHQLQIDTQSKNYCSEMDQLRKLTNSCPDFSLSAQIIQEYYEILINKVDLGKTTLRSARLAMKPASALMLIVSQSRLDLPTMWHVKHYISRCPGQASALTGFLNFLNRNHATKLDIGWLSNKKIRNRCKVMKLEKQLLGMMKLSIEEFDELEWISLGLRYFHKLDKTIYNQINGDSYTVMNDGFNVYLNNNIYWIPKIYEVLK